MKKIRVLIVDDSAVVHGMPKEAVKLGAVSEILPLDKIARAIVE